MNERGVVCWTCSLPSINKDLMTKWVDSSVDHASPSYATAVGRRLTACRQMR
jgi:hypothetical protein